MTVKVATLCHIGNPANWEQSFWFDFANVDIHFKSVFLMQFFSAIKQVLHVRLI